MDVLRKAQKETGQVKLTDATVEAVLAIREACAAEGIIASDRRWKKTLKLLQAAAYLAGAKETCPEDAALLTDSLWREPKERPKIARLVGKLADPVGSQANEILDAARETAQKVAAIKSTDRKKYVSEAAQALETFNQQQERLTKLAKSAGPRAKAVIGDATAEIQAMHSELARTVSAGLGLRASK
jgi:MoxR-like ATPase